MTSKLPVALYELTGEYVAAADKLADMDLPEDAIKDTLESLAIPLQEKAVAVAAMVRNFESLAMQIKIAENNMAQRRQALDKRAEHLKAYLKDNMNKAGMTEISCPQFALKIKKNPPSVDVFTANLVPDKFMRIPPLPAPTLDLTAIKAALTAGEEVAGAKLKQETRLEIK